MENLDIRDFKIILFLGLEKSWKLKKIIKEMTWNFYAQLFCKIEIAFGDVM